MLDEVGPQQCVEEEVGELWSRQFRSAITDRMSSKPLTHGERVEHVCGESLEGTTDPLRLDDPDQHLQHLPPSQSAYQPSALCAGLPICIGG